MNAVTAGQKPQSVDANYADRFKNHIRNIATFALVNRSEAAREPLAMIASGGALGMRELLTLLKLARDPSKRPRVLRVARKCDPKALLKLAEVLACQNLQPTDLEVAEGIYDLVYSAFGYKEFGYHEKLMFLELLAETQQHTKFIATYKRLRVEKETSNHTRLLAANFTNPWTGQGGNRQAARDRWQSLLAEIFASDWCEPISVPEDAESPFDSIRCVPESTVSDGPLVTVLVPTRDAGPRLDTALTCITGQSWRNLEILILDDCSDRAFWPQIDGWAERDRRIRVIRMREHVGTYAARNIGAREAQGEFLTVHDDDDWSHPRKIELQATALMLDPGSLGNMSQWVRATNDLKFLRINDNPVWIQPNYSSFMFRRVQVFEAIGYWDEVNRGADAEFRHRLVAWSGVKPEIVGDAPMSFGRVRDGSLTDGEIRRGYIDPRRRWYELSSSSWHSEAQENKRTFRLANPATERLFSAPDTMLPASRQVRHVDVIYATDFRFPGGNSSLSANEISALLDDGLVVGLLQLDSPLLNVKRLISPRISALARHPNCHIYSLLDEVTADLLLIRQPSVLQYARPEAGVVRAQSSFLIVNHPPSMRDGTGRDFDLPTCVQNAAAIFGAPPVVVPESGVIRKRIEEEVPGLPMGSFDWHGSMPLTARKPRRADPSRRPIIGRHSRDNAEKWPESLATLLSVYPTDGSRDVRILGGADTPITQHGLTDLDGAWTIYPFGTLEPGEFLASVDFWVYFHAETWIESFGMAIAEAMASGAVVILPEYLRPNFGDAALYAEPRDVQKLIDHYWYEAPDKYLEQSRRGIRTVMERFSTEVFLRRVRGLLPKRSGKLQADRRG